MANLFTPLAIAVWLGASAASAEAATIDLGLQDNRSQRIASLDFEGAAPPIVSPHASDFMSQPLLHGSNSGRFMPVDAQFMAGEIVSRLSHFDARHIYGPRAIVASDAGGAVLGTLGFQGTLGGIYTGDIPIDGRHAIGREKFSYEVTNLPGTIPEPERWAMLIIGFGLTGGAMRWRRRAMRERRVPVLARPARRRDR